MWRTVKLGVAILVITALVMGGIAFAQADEETPGRILEELTLLVEDGTLTRAQADAVAEQLAPFVRAVVSRFETDRLRHRLGRLAAETAEVLGISRERLAEQLAAGSSLAEIAAAEGTNGEQLVADVVEHLAAHLDVLVTSGRLEQERAEEILGNTERILKDLVDQPHPFRTAVRDRRNAVARSAGLAAAADLLDIPVAELREVLSSGRDLASVAADRGIGEDELISAILDPLEAALGTAVRSGRISEEKAAELLERAAGRVAEAIHRVPGG